MKSSILSTKTKEIKKYPYIGINTNIVILFTCKNTGILLVTNSESTNPTGWFSNTWLENNFIPLDEITIKFSL